MPRTCPGDPNCAQLFPAASPLANYVSDNVWWSPSRNEPVIESFLLRSELNRLPRREAVVPSTLCRTRIAAFLLFFVGFTLAHGQPSGSPAEHNTSSPDLVLQGDVRGSQNHTYVEVPFHVPPQVHRVTIRFAYTQKEQHTALDLGLLDPSQLRCWSGGNKSVLTVALSDATPSCQPGAIPSGEWNVLIGVPNIRRAVTSHYTIQVFFTRIDAVAKQPDFLREPLRSGPAWYRGDLHMHTAHSDGQCPSQTGKLVGCPVYFTVDAAARRGLDFIAITDHNATSQYDAMRELQPYFDKVLLIPGREITTFYAHLNFLGSAEYLDFRLGTRKVPTMNALIRDALRVGALVSINHPAAPSGEACMGCGWTPAEPVDMHLLTAIEAINGGTNSVAFWEKQLSLGYRLTGIGGSDNHRGTRPLDQPQAIGRPTTVVYASELSTPAILDGIRSGRVFIDLTGSHDRLVNVTAQAGGSAAQMGGDLNAPTAADVTVHVHVDACSGATAALIVDGQEPVRAQTIDAANQDLNFQWKSDGARHWLLAEIRDAGGRLLLLSNPVYVNWQQAHKPAQR